MPTSDLTPSTRELLDALLAGRPAAEQRLCEVFHPMLVQRAERHPLMKSIRRTATSEDVANEVWLRVLSQQSLETFEYRGRGSLGGFLGRILDNTMRDNVRRITARRRTGPSGGPIPLPAGVPDSELPTPTSCARAAELLELCRRSLTEREWTIFRMKELENHSAIEVGESLGIPASSVRRIHSAAREKLRAQLG